MLCFICSFVNFGLAKASDGASRPSARFFGWHILSDVDTELVDFFISIVLKYSNQKNLVDHPPLYHYSHIVGYGRYQTQDERKREVAT